MNTCGENVAIDPTILNLDTRCWQIYIINIPNFYWHTDVFLHLVCRCILVYLSNTASNDRLMANFKLEKYVEMGGSYLFSGSIPKFV
jgi:hypothetical protein